VCIFVLVESVGGVVVGCMVCDFGLDMSRFDFLVVLLIYYIIFYA
jgi:hypothetical protein